MKVEINKEDIKVQSVHSSRVPEYSGPEKWFVRVTYLPTGVTYSAEHPDSYLKAKSYAINELRNSLDLAERTKFFDSLPWEGV